MNDPKKLFFVISVSLAGLASCGATKAPADRFDGEVQPVTYEHVAMADMQDKTVQQTVRKQKRKAHRLDKVRYSSVDFGDAATTAAGLWTGLATEANPIFAPLGDAVPLVAMPVKYGLKKHLVKRGATPARANVTIEMGSSFATCANVATLLGAAPQVSLPMGLICSVAYTQETKKAYERDTGYTIDGVPVAEAGLAANK